MDYSWRERFVRWWCEQFGHRVSTKGGVVGAVFCARCHGLLGVAPGAGDRAHEQATEALRSLYLVLQTIGKDGAVLVPASVIEETDWSCAGIVRELEPDGSVTLRASNHNATLVAQVRH